MSERELREELEQLAASITRAEHELARWNTDERIAAEQMRLADECEELAQRGAAAKLELTNARGHLDTTEGELSLARSSLLEARRSIARIQSPPRRALGCLSMVALGVLLVARTRW